MTSSSSSSKPLGSLLLLMAINAIGGGVYGILSAEGVPVEWLKDTPFQTYFIPSLFLFVVVGGLSLTAAVLVFKQHRLALKAAIVSSVIMLVWIATQVTLIGYVSWLQPAVAVVGLTILILALLENN